MSRIYKTRSVLETVNTCGGQYRNIVFEVVDSRTGDIVLRTYNRRDARIETAYRNKYGMNGLGAERGAS